MLLFIKAPIGVILLVIKIPQSSLILSWQTNMATPSRNCYPFYNVMFHSYAPIQGTCVHTHITSDTQIYYTYGIQTIDAPRLAIRILIGNGCFPWIIAIEVCCILLRGKMKCSSVQLPIWQILIIHTHLHFEQWTMNCLILPLQRQKMTWGVYNLVYYQCQGLNIRLWGLALTKVAAASTWCQKRLGRQKSCLEAIP